MSSGSPSFSSFRRLPMGFHSGVSQVQRFAPRNRPPHVAHVGFAVPKRLVAEKEGQSVCRSPMPGLLNPPPDCQLRVREL